MGLNILFRFQKYILNWLHTEKVIFESTEEAIEDEKKGRKMTIYFGKGRDSPFG